jgi:diacylglycerol kinase (ATP)
MPPKIKLIFNPMANLKRAWTIGAEMRPIVDELGGADWAGTVYPTHASQLAFQAGRDGYDWVVAMGGDGTIHEVINGLMQIPAEHRPHLGIVPVGSGNDFAYSMGISKTPEIALRQLFKGEHRPMDIGLIEDDLGRREYWMNTIGIGFDAVVNIRSRNIPIVQGFLVYFAAVMQTILLNYTPYQLKMNIDGKIQDEQFLMLTLCNGKREGGGFELAPQACQDDGKLEYIAVNRISRPRMLMTVPYFMKGTHAGLKYVRTGQFERMELQSNQPLHIHTDGEVFAGLGSHTRGLNVQVVHNALTVISSRLPS